MKINWPWRAPITIAIVAACFIAGDIARRPAISQPNNPGVVTQGAVTPGNRAVFVSRFAIKDGGAGGSGTVLSVTCGSTLTCTPNPITATGTIDLPTTAVAAGAYGSATAVGTFTVDAFGRLTAAADATVTPAIGSITGLAANCATWLATSTSANLAACLTNETGTGLVVFNNSPTLITPALGTPASGVLTNTTGLPLASVLNAGGAQGDIQYWNGSNWTRLAPGTAGQRLLTNGAAANPSWGGGPLATTTQVFLSGSGTYTTPAGARALIITMLGGGGGGAGSGSGGTGGTGGTGGNTTFSTLAANGGTGATGNSATPSTGGSVTGGYDSTPGSAGQGGSTNTGVASVFQWGGHGGSSCISGGGFGSFGPGSATSPPANTGAGGGGAGGGNAALNLGGGGASGGCVNAIITTPAASYSYGVGAAGAAGTAGTSGAAGGAGAAGKVVVLELY